MLGKEKIEYPVNTTLPTSKSLVTGLPGKVIIITGANTGIGAAVAKGCLDAGAKSVYSIDLREPSGTNEFVAVQAEYPGQAFHLNGDVTKIETLQKAFATVLEKEGTIDGVVANAGVTIRKGALEYTPEEWDFIINVNLKGVVNTCNVAVNTFLSLQKTGSIVVTASMVSHGTNKSAPSLPYQATKSAILGVVRGFAAEFGPQGIRINCVSPGYIQTALTTYHLTDDMWDYKLGLWGGLHRLGEPRELAGTYVYFLSDASSFTSGVDIKVHGATDAW